jgi:raffinose/stachyose/melibiose transport system permease protein
LARIDENRIAESKMVKTSKAAISVILVAYSFIAVFLIGNTILSSFKSKQELINNTIGFPNEFTLENYSLLLFEKGFLRYFVNSFTLVACSLILLLTVSAMAAYGLSRFEFKGRGILQTYFLIGIMFPIQLGILPLFIMLTRMNLNNNILGLALLYAANMSFPLFVFSKFFRGIPYSLTESARIDGAKEFSVFVKIVLPMSKPVLFTMGLINFVMIWNDFYMPLVFLTKASNRTLTLAVYSFMANFLANWHLVFAAAVIALLPVIIIFFRFSDQIVAGLVGGAIKE